MATIEAIAERFFEACETGQGWQECQQYCSPRGGHYSWDPNTGACRCW